VFIGVLEVLRRFGGLTGPARTAGVLFCREAGKGKYRGLSTAHHKNKNVVLRSR